MYLVPGARINTLSVTKLQYAGWNINFDITTSDMVQLHVRCLLLVCRKFAFQLPSHIVHRSDHPSQFVRSIRHYTSSTVALWACYCSAGLAANSKRLPPTTGESPRRSAEREIVHVNLTGQPIPPSMEMSTPLSSTPTTSRSERQSLPSLNPSLPLSYNPSLQDLRPSRV